MRNDVLAKKPGQIVALIKAWGAAVGQYRTNKGPSQAIITKAVGAKPGELTTAFDGVILYNLAQNESQLARRYIKKTIVDVKRIATQAGLIKGDDRPLEADRHHVRRRRGEGVGGRPATAPAAAVRRRRPRGRSRIGGHLGAAPFALISLAVFGALLLAWWLVDVAGPRQRARAAVAGRGLATACGSCRSRATCSATSASRSTGSPSASRSRPRWRCRSGC